MDYKLPRHTIVEDLQELYTKKVAETELYLPKAKKLHVDQIHKVSALIEQDGLPKHLYVQKLKGNIGHGVFLHPNAKPIQKGDVIAPYSGEVFLCPLNESNNSDYVFTLIDKMYLSKEEQGIWDPKNRYHPRRHYSLNLDAGKTGNFTRFINHSEKPNVKAEHLTIPVNAAGKKKPSYEIVYLAKKTINPGEQLLVCYEGGDTKSYWGALKIEPFKMTPTTFKLNEELKLVSK
jgi:hypothetical protein